MLTPLFLKLKNNYKKIESVLDIKSLVSPQKNQNFSRLSPAHSGKILVILRGSMKNAELYSTSNGMQKKDAEEILIEFRDKMKWKNEARILDVGCGSGDITFEKILPQLPKDFKEIVGIDFSLEMIQHARNQYSQNKVIFVQFDIAQKYDNILKKLSKTIRPSTNSSINLKETKTENHNLKIMINNSNILESQTLKRQIKKNLGFDFIFSFYCLHWVFNQKLAFKNIYKLLNPDGEALLIFLAKSPIFILYRRLSEMDVWKKYMMDVDNFIPFYQDSESPLDIFLEIVKKTGFVDIETDCRERSYVFDSLSALRKAIIAVNPFISRIPEELHEDFINECLYQTKLLNLLSYTNNCYKVTYKLIVAHLKKPEP